MTKTIFIVPIAQPCAMSSVWIDTGNPAQPLGCV